jgi:hypothetical protein
MNALKYECLGLKFVARTHSVPRATLRLKEPSRSTQRLTAALEIEEEPKNRVSVLEVTMDLLYVFPSHLSTTRKVDKRPE